MQTEGIEVRSVGNTLTLHKTALIEAFNLKAAIEYLLKNQDAAREALTGNINIYWKLIDLIGGILYHKYMGKNTTYAGFHGGIIIRRRQ